MASQTEAQVQTEIKNRIAICEEILKSASVNSSGSLSNYIAREETALDNPGGDYTPASNAALRSAIRQALANSINAANLRAVFDPLLRNYARAVGTVDENLPIGGPGGILDLLKRRAVVAATLVTVNSRGITYGSPSAGSNLGSGTVHRLTVDPWGYNLEACHMEAKKFECIRDQITGAEKHEEFFRVRGATRLGDQLQIDGSGANVELPAMSSRRSLITNPSFSEFGGTITSLTDVSGWTPGSGVYTSLNLDQSNYYRTAGGLSDATPASLKFLGNESVSQAFSVNNVKLVDGVPYYCQIAYNREVGSCDGTLTLTVGTKSVSVALSAQTGWNILKLPLDKNLYPLNFADTTSPTVKVQLSGRTTGTLLVDDIVWVPMAPVDGTWWVIVGGATPFVAGNRDTFTVTDSLAGSDAIIQKWFWRLYGHSWPSNTSGGETWTDPTV